MNRILTKLILLICFVGAILYFNYPSFKRFFLTSQADIEKTITAKYELAEDTIAQLSKLKLALPEVEKRRIRLLLDASSADFNIEHPAIKNVIKDYFEWQEEEDKNYLVQVKFGDQLFISDFSKALNQVVENINRIKKIRISETKDSIIFEMEENRRLALDSAPINTILESDLYDWLYDGEKQEYRARLADPPNLLNLGLDLQGGIYLDIGIEKEKALADFMQRRLELIENSLNDVGFEYQDVSSDLASSITIETEAAADFNQFEQELATTTEGLDVEVLANQVKFVLQKDYADAVQKDALTQAMDVIRSRIDLLGVKEPTIQKRGSESIVVQIPGQTDSLRIKELITKPANLEFRFVVAGADAANPDDDSEVLYFETLDKTTKEVVDTEPIVVEKKMVLQGDVISDARVVFDQFTGVPQVSMTMRPEGASLFGQITAENVGRSLAIILDKKIRSYPRINQAIYGGQASITGQFSVDEARDLAIILRSGALPVSLVVNEERVVGATLGEESILKSIYALTSGFVILGLFIVIYYAFSGILAAVILLINLLMILAVLSFFGATLTLPGIAGIILTIGMAVDANVLIFERIREELKQGAAPRKAVQQGFSRVAVTIIDANLTTLMVAAVLFQFGVGSVRGFAITLAIGIMTTIFTSLVISHWLYDLVYLRKHHLERISI